jgi:hypothetical protein
VERDPRGESLVCWLCDNGLLLLALVVLVIVAGLRWDTLPSLSNLPLFSTPTPSPTLKPPPTITPTVAATIVPTLTPTDLPTSTPPLPNFVMVFIPLHWQSGRDAFESAAWQQAENFIVASGIQDYFTVDVILLENGLDDAQLDSSELVYELVEFGLEQMPGDRYIGLTDGDIAPEGINDVVGWTTGGLGIVSESNDLFVTAHELGHTFGLCDEYSYREWFRQNEEYPGGCPNPYPPDCPQDFSDGVSCDGMPTIDGKNSIMGPAGLSGDYSFNQSSIVHLRQILQKLAEESIR